MGRPEWITADNSKDRYLKPRDGRLALLKVQGTTDSHHPQDNVTWERSIFKDKTPIMTKLVLWCVKSVPELAQGGQLAKQQGRADVSTSDNGTRKFLTREWREMYLGRDRQIMYLKWIPTCLGLLFLVSVTLRNIPSFHMQNLAD
jgi:hypothetical protein